MKGSRKKCGNFYEVNLFLLFTIFVNKYHKIAIWMVYQWKLNLSIFKGDVKNKFKTTS